MNQILIKPVKRLFAKRQQWVFELRAANGERVDPRDTYNNRDEAIAGIASFSDPGRSLELVVFDKFGNVETRTQLR